MSNIFEIHDFIYADIEEKYSCLAEWRKANNIQEPSTVWESKPEEWLDKWLDIIVEYRDTLEIKEVSISAGGASNRTNRLLFNRLKDRLSEHNLEVNDDISHDRVELGFGGYRWKINFMSFVRHMLSKSNHTMRDIAEFTRHAYHDNGISGLTVYQNFWYVDNGVPNSNIVNMNRDMYEMMKKLFRVYVDQMYNILSMLDYAERSKNPHMLYMLTRMPYDDKMSENNTQPLTWLYEGAQENFNDVDEDERNRYMPLPISRSFEDEGHILSWEIRHGIRLLNFRDRREKATLFNDIPPNQRRAAILEFTELMMKLKYVDIREDIAENYTDYNPKFASKKDREHIIFAVTRKSFFGNRDELLTFDNLTYKIVAVYNIVEPYGIGLKRYSPCLTRKHNLHSGHTYSHIEVIASDFIDNEQPFGRQPQENRRYIYHNEESMGDTSNILTTSFRHTTTCHICGTNKKTTTLWKYEEINQAHIERCGIVKNDEALPGGVVVCSSCYSHHYIHSVLRDDFVRENDYLIYLPEGVERAPIPFMNGVGSWDFAPKFEFFRTEDDVESPLYMGVELEMDKGGEATLPASCILSKLTRNQRNLAYMVHDGSLHDGIELVTMPATLNAHKEYFNYEDAFKLALDLEYRSHNTSTCGIHVHVNRDFFHQDKQEQLRAGAYMSLFIQNNEDDIVSFARRSYDEVREWARIKNVKKNPHNYEQPCITDRFLYEYEGDKYVAVNVGHRQTFELRIFKGTLRYETYMATLQFVSNLAHFVRDNLHKDEDFFDDVSFEDIITYKHYEELEKYLATRGSTYDKFIWSERTREDDDYDGNECDYCSGNYDDDDIPECTCGDYNESDDYSRMNFPTNTYEGE